MDNRLSKETGSIKMITSVKYHIWSSQARLMRQLLGATAL